MILLQVIPELEAGGAERTVLDVAEAVIAAGGQALVASQGGRLEDELEALGGRHVRLPLKSKNPITIWRNAARLARLIRAQGVQIVHARSRAPAWSAMWAARRADVHFVTTYHGVYNARSGAKRWYNSVMARGDRVIANSQFTADHVRAEHGVGEDRLRVIPRGVDLDRARPEAVSEDRIAALRSAWGVAENETRPILLLPARLTRWKGQLVAIEALAKPGLAEAQAPILILAGDDQGRTEYRAELENRAAALGLDDRVRLPGHVTDIPAALALADLVLTPSIEPEAFGRTTAEAGAMGRAVIAADHGGAREIIVQGETGWRVPPGDADALAKAISHALQIGPEARAAIGEAARIRVRERFSKASLQSATLQVYQELLE